MEEKSCPWRQRSSSCDHGLREPVTKAFADFRYGCVVPLLIRSTSARVPAEPSPRLKVSAKVRESIADLNLGLLDSLARLDFVKNPATAALAFSTLLLAASAISVTVGEVWQLGLLGCGRSRPYRPAQRQSPLVDAFQLQPR